MSAHVRHVQTLLFETLPWLTLSITGVGVNPSAREIRIQDINLPSLIRPPPHDCSCSEITLLQTLFNVCCMLQPTGLESFAFTNDADYTVRTG